MGTVVIGGLLVASLLTLFFTPVFYVGAERLLRRREASAPGNEPKGEPAPTA